ncbi:MAG: hypothetical protein AAFX94_04705, partial [Myxococcota bacterium]
MNTRLIPVLLLCANCAVMKGVGGATSGPSGPEPEDRPAPTEVEDEIGDEEEGIDAISARLKQFSKALAAKDFEGAGRYLRRSELSIENADDLTRGHPEFDDKVDAVERAKERYERALEQDRIERRNTAIAELIAQGERALGDGRALFAEMNARTPNEQDADALGEVITLLAKLRADGKQYEGFAQYRFHAEDRDVKTEALRDRLKLAQWQIATSAYMESPIARGQKALDAGNKAEDRTTKLKALQVATTAYKQCVDQFTQLSGRKDYDGDRLIKTSFGDQSLAETRTACRERYDRLAGQLASVQWNSLVTSVLAEVKTSLERYEKSSTSAQKLEASAAAIAALDSCKGQMKRASKKKGYDRKKAFESPFGSATVPQLERSCTKRAALLTKERPTLVWRAEVDGFAETLNVITKDESKASAEKDPAKRAVMWDGATSALQACELSAATLLRKRNADKRYVAQTAFGPLTVSGIQSECVARLGKAKDAGNDAEQERKIAGFLATAKGDEAVIAKKKGIPSLIKSVPGGRIFYYRDGRSSFEKYGFDSEGRSVDFDAQWLAGFAKIANSVTAAMGRVDIATNGTELKTAITTATGELKKCASALDGAEKRAGADSKAKQKSALGTLTVVEMRRACTLEARKLSSRVLEVDWQV